MSFWKKIIEEIEEDIDEEEENEELEENINKGTYKTVENAYYSHSETKPIDTDTYIKKCQEQARKFPDYESDKPSFTSSTTLEETLEKMGRWTQDSIKEHYGDKYTKSGFDAFDKDGQGKSYTPDIQNTIEISNLPKRNRNRSGCFPIDD